MDGVLRAALVLLSVMQRVSGQRAPCYECELYRDLHPQSKPYQEIRSHCSYPCSCPGPAHGPTCGPGVSVIRDGCDCCDICARQPGDKCDATRLCDENHGLVCQYPHQGAVNGVCKVIKGLPCTVLNRTYDNGETFLLDCRTQCSCQNGTYACASLCPQEAISPLGACLRPRLVEVPGQCCREWLCDGSAAQQPPVCVFEYTPWSPCSSLCGLGLSHRVSNLNPRCEPANETRLCQLRPCEDSLSPLTSILHATQHQVRKGHECKATQRVSSGVRLRFGSCVSRKRYRPKFCADCRHLELSCSPLTSTTIQVEFHCDIQAQLEEAHDLLVDLAEPASDLWFSDQEDNTLQENEEDHKHRLPADLNNGNKLLINLQLILRCHCTSTLSDVEATKQTLLHRVHRTTQP